MGEHYLSTDFSSSIDEDTNFISCHVKITINDSGTDQEVKIGYATLYFINVYQSADWNQVIYFADAVDGDLYTIVEGLTNIIANEEEAIGLLATINSVKIDKGFRGRGYGTKAIEKIMKYLDILSFDYIALHPFPVEEKDEDSEQNSIEKLVAFYNSFGLEIVNKENNTQLIMGKNLNLM